MNACSIRMSTPYFDACFFCLGVSSAGMTEAAYRRVTFDIPMTAAQTLVRLDPTMTFIHVSGTGTDSSEHGRIMWARVKGHRGRVAAAAFQGRRDVRPAGIVPLHGVTSKTRPYRALYALTRPLWPLLYAAFPQYVTTTEQVGARNAPRGSAWCHETDS